jgi:hypothetical protein
MPPPVPPSVKLGRITIGSRRRRLARDALLHRHGVLERVGDARLAEPRPMPVIASLNCSRSSAFWMACSLAPIISTPCRSRTPWCARSSAQLSAVCPPIVGSSAIRSPGCSARSFSMIFSTTCQVMGSMYVASAVPGSVMIVAGFEFTRTTRKPSSRSALQAWAPE